MEMNFIYRDWSEFSFFFSLSAHRSLVVSWIFSELFALRKFSDGGERIVNLLALDVLWESLKLEKSCPLYFIPWTNETTMEGGREKILCHLRRSLILLRFINGQIPLAINNGLYLTLFSTLLVFFFFFNEISENPRRLVHSLDFYPKSFMFRY